MPQDTWSYFQRQQKRWQTAHAGQWVAICAAAAPTVPSRSRYEVSDFFVSIRQAYLAARELWSGRPFAIYQVGDKGVSGVIRSNRASSTRARAKA
jgi:hypothetical protein